MAFWLLAVHTFSGVGRSSAGLCGWVVGGMKSNAFMRRRRRQAERQQDTQVPRECPQSRENSMIPTVGSANRTMLQSFRSDADANPGYESAPRQHFPPHGASVTYLCTEVFCILFRHRYKAFPAILPQLLFPENEPAYHNFGISIEFLPFLITIDSLCKTSISQGWGK